VVHLRFDSNVFQRDSKGRTTPATPHAAALEIQHAH
jgi:hypothetical protein